MKILMFGWEYPPHVSGGLGTACYGLTQAMALKGDDIQFVIPKKDHASPTGNRHLQLINASNVILPQSLGSHQLAQLNRVVPDVMDRWLRFKGNDERFQFSGAYGTNLMEEIQWYTLVAVTLAQTQTFDIIHAHDWLTFGAGMAAKAISGKPLVIHVHATEHDRSPVVNPEIYALECRGMQAADKVIAVSNFTRNIIINRYHIPSHKVVTAYNGVNPKKPVKPEVIKKKNKTKTVTFLGRITYQKGPEYFIEAACKVLEKEKNVRFVMAGTGDMLPAMIEKVAKYGLTPYFHFTGFLNGPAVNRLFSMSDVYVMPSVSEPFGITPLEAIQSGVPVIVSNQSGVAEVLPAAMKVDFWDTDSLANAIYGLIRYQPLAQSVQEKGKNELEGLTWEKAAQQVLSVYSGVA